MIAAVAFLAVGSSGAYLSDTVTVTGNSFTAGTWDNSNDKVVINEVYYDGTKEWIELYNSDDATIDIKGWSICDNTDSCGSLNPEQKTEIIPGEFVIVAHDAGDLNGWLINPLVDKIYYAGNKISFNDTGDAVILKDDNNSVVDQMSYGSDTTAFSPSCPLVADGHSLQRNPAGHDTGTKNDFFDQITPTPGA